MWREMPKYATHLISNSGAGAEQLTLNLEQLTSKSMHVMDDMGTAPLESLEGEEVGEDQDQEIKGEVAPWV